MINAFAYFPTIIYRDEHPEWVEYTLKFLEKYFDKNKNQDIFFQTENVGNNLEINFFTNYLLSTSRDILNGQGYAIDRYELYISSLWGQELKQYASSNVHVHKNSQLCGWFFLETPHNGSYPVYYDTRNNKQMVELDSIYSEEVTNATSSIHFNNIVPGTVLFSNSWMQHQITTNMSDKPTKAIHFIISHQDKLCNTC